MRETHAKCVILGMYDAFSNSKSHLITFYRTMHVVLARYCYCNLSVRPSVCDVDVSWAYRSDLFKLNNTNN